PVPYYYVSWMSTVAAVASVPLAARLWFKIAAHEEYSSRAIDTFWLIRDHEPSGEGKRMMGMEPLDPAQYPALQAADLFSWLWNKSLAAKAGVTTMNAVEASTLRAITHRETNLIVSDAADLDRQIAEQVARNAQK